MLDIFLSLKQKRLKSPYRCNGRVQLTDVHAARRVLTVVSLVRDLAILIWLHCRLGGVGV